MPERQIFFPGTEQDIPVLPIEPVRKSIRVKTTADRAFRVFTEHMDSWWPRTHHIGSAPLKRVVMECHPGGAVYSEQEDGTLCPWGSVIAWRPPYEFAMAWQIKPDWSYEPDPTKCSEVHVRFTPTDDGGTLVELEHRGFERHGRGGETMRESVNSEGGWGALLALFAAKSENPE